MNQFSSINLLAVVFLGFWTSEVFAEDWRLGVKIVAANGGGVEVVEIFANSPAEKIGLRTGDVIVTINGNVVNDTAKTRELVFASGERAKVVYKGGNAFYEVDAEFQVAMVTTVIEGKEVREKRVQVNDIKRKQVPDPRKK